MKRTESRDLLAKKRTSVWTDHVLLGKNSGVSEFGGALVVSPLMDSINQASKATIQAIYGDSGGAPWTKQRRKSLTMTLDRIDLDCITRRTWHIVVVGVL